MSDPAPSGRPAPECPPPAVQVRCVAGPDAGKVYTVDAAGLVLGRATGVGLGDEALGDAEATLAWRGSTLHFSLNRGHTLLVNARAFAEGDVPPGQQFQLGASTWQVGDPSPHGAAALLSAVQARLNDLAGTERLEGFSLGALFSEVFRRHSRDDLDAYFLLGTSHTTPPIESVDTGWPKPWLFVRVLIFVGVVYLGFTLALDQFRNTNLIPGLIMMGSLAAPLATVILFFELNTPRNIAFHRVLMLVAAGGIVSLFVSLFGFSVANLSFLGASQAGIVEEVGKIVAVALVVREVRYRYILNGLLAGAAIGAGFAIFESAGYAFNALLGSRSFDSMTTTILVRAFLAPFGHVAWTAIAAGALGRVKGDQPLRPRMLLDPRFLRPFCIPVVLHMLWNMPLPSPLFLRHLALGAVGWFVVFGFVQEGLRQIKAEQAASRRAGPPSAMPSPLAVPGAPGFPSAAGT